MESCGLEAVNQPLEEAASQLSLDSLRDNKNAPYSLKFAFVKRYLPNSLWKIDDVTASSSSLPKIFSAILLLFESFTLICPIRKTRSIFWKAEDRQATWL